MSNHKLPLAVMLIVQVVAFLIYPPAYFQQAPQAAVLPPSLLVLFIAALVGLYTGVLSVENARNSLVFIQGINLVVRIMTLFPNLRTPTGDWAWALLITQGVGIALSWFAMVTIEKVSMRKLMAKTDKSNSAHDMQSAG